MQRRYLRAKKNELDFNTLRETNADDDKDNALCWPDPTILFFGKIFKIHGTLSH
jgi:hypothetical protein